MTTTKTDSPQENPAESPDTEGSLDAQIDACAARIEQMIQRNRTTIDRVDEGF